MRLLTVIGFVLYVCFVSLFWFLAVGLGCVDGRLTTHDSSRARPRRRRVSSLMARTTRWEMRCGTLS
jgi:hypothetical protein